MYAAGPRLERRFLDGVVQLDDSTVPIAETYRRARDLAMQMGIPRPSYERLRVHLRAARRRQDERQRTRELLFQLNTRPADAVVQDLLALLD